MNRPLFAAAAAALLLVRPAPAAPTLDQQLMSAVGRRDCPAVRSLLARGANPNADLPMGMRPLMSAAFLGDVEIARALLNAGAQMNQETMLGNALTTSVIGQNWALSRLLLTRGSALHSKRPDRITLLMMVSRAGRVNLLGLVLSRKQDVDARDASGMTALMHAARQGQAEAVRVLLKRGAKLELADGEGLTPLMHAALTGQAECARLLLAAGARASAKDRTGRTALHLAANYRDNPATVRVLLAAGARRDARDSQGRTPLDLARLRGFTASARLLDAGGSVAVSPALPAPAAAARKSLERVEASMRAFTQRTGCVSCHNEGFARWTVGFAREHGAEIDKSLQETQSKRVLAEIEQRKPLHLKALRDPKAMSELGGPFGDLVPEYTALLMGAAANQEPPTEGISAAAMILARLQSPDGSWPYDMPRGPMQSSRFTMTAMALQIITRYAPKDYAAEVEQRLARARTWLLSAPVKTSEDRAFRLLGLKSCGASAGERSGALRELLAGQRLDGGWARLPGLKSDAYATGQALFALHEGGELAASDPAYRKGVEFLLRTQDDSGAWFVNKEVMPGNFYFDTGFPYGQSQFISHSATGWATMALLLAAEEALQQAAAGR